MALGGGFFTAQNKILPGTYINFVSTKTIGTSLSERGVVTLPLELGWGPEKEMFAVKAEDFATDAVKIFGVPASDDSLKPVRELFRHSNLAYLFRLNASGVKAANSFATAKYSGTVGNDLTIVITANEASTTLNALYDVATYLGTALVDMQRAIAGYDDLVDNDYLEWKDSLELDITAGTALTGGTDGSVTDAAYTDYLTAAEGYNFNAMGCLSTSGTIQALFIAFVQRMRDEVGKKFQVVLSNATADYEGVVNVKNGIVDSTSSSALIPWVTGVIAGTAVHQSATNLEYDGEYDVYTIYSQTQLENTISDGLFTFHAVDDKVCVLEDINSLHTFTDEKGEDFAHNQTIRVLDQIANDIAYLFASKYMGKIPNDKSGRISLWTDIVKHHQELENLRAIEDFNPDNVTVTPGESKRAVVVTDQITPINALEQLYMTVYIQ